MEVIQNKALLLKLRNPNKVTTLIPKSKQVGDNKVLVNWGLDEVRVLRNLQLKNVPSPIMGKYNWPGMYKPFDHQKTTASFLTLNRRAFCLNEQGTGKTGSVIWAADYLLKIGAIKRVLVICPLSIMDSAWRADLFKFAMHRTVDIAYGSKEKRIRVINSTAEFVVINYDGVNIIEDEIANGGFDLIVVDEANAYKNVQTTRWKTLNRILKPDTWLWMLTGTPAAHSPVDAYGLARLVNPNGVPKFFGTFKDMVMYKLTQFKWMPRPDADKMVYEVLQPAIRFTKDECLDLPDRTYVTREVELTPQQKKYYEMLRKQLVVQTTGEQITAVNAAVGLSKLLQISCIVYDTPVLTDFGWIPIQHVTPLHKVWDGEAWITQEGAVFRGEKEVEKCFGVTMTLDHKVLTTKGWKSAEDIIYGGSGKKFNRAEVRVPDSYRTSWNNNGNFNSMRDVALSVRLWSAGSSEEPIFENERQETSEELRMSSRQRNTQNELYKSLFKLHEYATKMPRFIGQRLQKLRGAWDYGMPKLARFIRIILGRHGAYTPGGLNTRPDRQQWSVQSAELSMGYPQGTGAQHTGEYPDNYFEGSYDHSASSGGIRNQICHLEATSEGGLAYRSSPDSRTKQKQKTYDLLNCGPRSRFVVAGKEGPLIVHNCGAVYSDSGETLEFDIKNRYKILLEVIEEANHKILIFVPFKNTIKLLTDKLREDGFTTEIINGDVSASQRNDIFKRFQTTPDPRILVIQPQAAAHGVTLTAADTTVWWGPTSRPEIYNQANDRFHRAGQQHNVTVVRLQGSNAEKHVYRMLDNKIVDHAKLVDLYQNLLD